MVSTVRTGGVAIELHRTCRTLEHVGGGVNLKFCSARTISELHRGYFGHIQNKLNYISTTDGTNGQNWV